MCLSFQVIKRTQEENVPTVQGWLNKHVLLVFKILYLYLLKLLICWKLSAICKVICGLDGQFYLKVLIGSILLLHVNVVFPNVFILHPVTRRC